MVALAGEPWRGYAKITIRDASVGGNVPARRHYALSIADVNPSLPGDDGNQSPWEGTPGQTFTLRLEWSTQGSDNVPPLVPTFDQATIATVNVRLPGDAANIGGTWIPSIIGDSGVATRTFHFDDNPLNQSAGSNRSGMLEIFFSVEKATVPAWGPVDSRGNGTPPVTTTLDNARGYLRSNFVISSYLISNASLGGAEPSIFAAPKSTFNRINLSAVSYRAYALTHAHRQGGADKRSNVGASETGTQRDFTYNTTSATVGGSGRINNGYTAASTVTAVRLTLPTLDFGGDNEHAWAASGHATGFAIVSGDVKVLEHATRFTVDPRLNMKNSPSSTYHALYHTQATGISFFDPPSSGNNDAGQRQFPDIAFVGVRYSNAEAEGQNGLSVTLKMWDSAEAGSNESSPAHSFSGTTATRRDPPPAVATPEAGWLPLSESGTDENKLPLTWSTVINGNWKIKSVVTAPSDLTGLEIYPNVSGGSSWNRTVALVVVNPNINVAFFLNNLTGPGRHPIAGDVLKIVASAVDETTGLRILPESAYFWMTHATTAGVLQHLVSITDNTSAAWEDWSATTVRATHALDIDGTTKLASKTFSATAGWGTTPVVPRVVMFIAGTPYPAFLGRELVGPVNSHDAVISIRIVAGNVSAAGRHVIIGDAITIGAVLNTESTTIAHDTGSAVYYARRFNAGLPPAGKLQSWDASAGAWVTTNALIANPLTTGANPGEPLVAFATIVGAGVDRTDDIFIDVSMNRTVPGTGVVQRFLATVDVAILASKFKHDTNEPEASIDFDAEAGHSHWGQDGPGSNELSGRFIPRTPPA